MTTILYLLRFFRVVSPLPGLVVWTFGAIVGGAGAIVVIAPARAAGAMAPLLVLLLILPLGGRPAAQGRVIEQVLVKVNRDRVSIKRPDGESG